MAITLTQLEYFCELAETGSFGRAAERLHMSQPPLSRQIALLEKHLGAALFERGPKGAALTPAGRQLLVDAREALRHVALAERNAKAAARGDAGRLTLGFTMCAAYSVVPAVTRLYKEARPDVAFQVREMLPVALESSLRDGAIDFGIAFPSAGSPELRARPLLREPLKAVLPAGHPLARGRRRRRLRVEELAGESFLVVPRDQVPSLHDAVVQRCEAAGFAPKIGLEVYLQQTIVNLVAEGLGVAFVPASMQKAPVPGAVFRDVDDPPLVEQVLVWHAANANPCLRGFLAVCEEFARAAEGK